MPDAVPDAAAPAGRRLVFPRRLAVAASGLAALFLVALGVRWMVAGDAPIPGSPRVLESARAPEHLETGDLVREGLPAGGAAADGVVAGERERAGGVLPQPVTTPDARAPAAVAAPGTAPAAAPSAPAGPTAGPVPPPPATGPAPARGAGFQPGDQVPPRLRTPTDDRADRDELERAAGDRRGAREEKSAATARTGAPALPTWTLEADDLASGRARLALLVGGLDAPSLAGDGLRLGAAGPDDLVLGSVVLCLPAARFAALAPAGSDGGLRPRPGRVSTEARRPTTRHTPRRGARPRTRRTSSRRPTPSRPPPTRPTPRLRCRAPHDATRRRGKPTGPRGSPTRCGSCSSAAAAAPPGSRDSAARTRA